MSSVQREIVDYSRETVPAWYELSLSAKDIIELRVKRLVLGGLDDLDWDKAPIISESRNAFGLTEFSHDWEADIGFNKCLKRQGSDSEWSIWQFKLPNLNHNSRTCASREEVFSLRATLQVLFILFHFPETRPRTMDKPQLLVFTGFCLEDDLHGGSLAVMLTPTVIKYFSRYKQESELQDVSRAMREAYFLLWPSRENEKLFRYDFSAVCRGDGSFHMSIPGNACGLDPEYGSRDYEDEGEGYCLTPHNVDSSLQQLTFLAGLAKLHDLVRAG